MSDLTLRVEVAKKIWKIASISAEHGNAVMDIIGEGAYQHVMNLRKCHIDSEEES